MFEDYLKAFYEVKQDKLVYPFFAIFTKYK